MIDQPSGRVRPRQRAQRVSPILQLRLQAHVAGTIERKDRGTDDDDLTASVSSQSARIDCEIFPATIVEPMAVLFGALRGPPHGDTVFLAPCDALENHKLLRVATACGRDA